MSFRCTLVAEMRLPCGICILLYLKCVIFSIFVRTLFRAAFSYRDRWWWLKGNRVKIPSSPAAVNLVKLSAFISTVRSVRMGRSRKYGVSQKTCKVFVCGFEEKPGENALVVNPTLLPQGSVSFPFNPPRKILFPTQRKRSDSFARNWSVLWADPYGLVLAGWAPYKADLRVLSFSILSFFFIEFLLPFGESTGVWLSYRIMKSYCFSDVTT